MMSSPNRFTPSPCTPQPALSATVNTLKTVKFLEPALVLCTSLRAQAPPLPEIDNITTLCAKEELTKKVDTIVSATLGVTPSSQMSLDRRSSMTRTESRAGGTAHQRGSMRVSRLGSTRYVFLFSRVVRCLSNGTAALGCVLTYQ